jgi:hypothetical protein
LWNARLAAYGPGDYQPPGGKRPPSAKGRWFARFAGGVADVAKADAAKIVEGIYEHLHCAQYQMRAEEQIRKDGLIAARAKSIANNVFDAGERPGQRANVCGWSEADRAAYVQEGDVASEIRRAAERRERGEGDSGPRGQPTRRANPGRASADLAGAALYAHYGRLFKGADGKPLTIREAEEQKRGLFNLHAAVKAAYARILKHNRKDLPEHKATPNNSRFGI